MVMDTLGASSGHHAPPLEGGAARARTHPMSSARDWPALDWASWADTARHLHLMSQVIGKWRLARTPWVNHSWHATLYPVPRGLSTGPVHDQSGTLTLTLDFRDMALTAHHEGEGTLSVPLGPGSMAEFAAAARDLIARAGGAPLFHGRPNEIEPAIPFDEDTEARPWDAEAVRRYHAALLRIVPVFERFRTGFLGKVSPVHLFWGSFDLAVTRFSGRRAPLHPGGIPNLPDAVTHEAYSHEVSSAGFWPGEGAGEAMFYSYAYPTPDGFAEAAVRPEAARWDEALGEFLLPYVAVAEADDPEETLMAFLLSTYRAAAETGGWDRDALECSLGEPGRPRPVSAP